MAKFRQWELTTNRKWPITAVETDIIHNPNSWVGKLFVTCVVTDWHLCCDLIQCRHEWDEWYVRFPSCDWSLILRNGFSLVENGKSNINHPFSDDSHSLGNIHCCKKPAEIRFNLYARCNSCELNANENWKYCFNRRCFTYLTKSDT